MNFPDLNPVLGLDEIEIEERFKNIEVPLSFAGRSREKPRIPRKNGSSVSPQRLLTVCFDNYGRGKICRRCSHAIVEIWFNERA